MNACLSASGGASWATTCSAKYAGFSGRKNVGLLRLAAEAGYDVLLTVDQGIPFQQRMSGQSLALIVISAPRSDIDTLKVMADSVIRALATIAATSSNWITRAAMRAEYSPTQGGRTLRHKRGANLRVRPISSIRQSRSSPAKPHSRSAGGRRRSASLPSGNETLPGNGTVPIEWRVTRPELPLLRHADKPWRVGRNGQA